MYSLPYFKEHEHDVVMEFIHQHPFAFLSGCDENNRPVATQILVFIENRGEKLFLTGHMMRSTDHHKAFEKNPNVLCVFTGHHTYVSATWYSNPHQASTWNYMTIHARGPVRWMDEGELIELLKELSLHFENNNQASTTIYDNLPEDYLEKLRKAIIGFEIEVTELDNVYKLSQNRDEKSYDNVVEQLKKQEGDGKIIGEIMEKRKEKVFK